MQWWAAGGDGSTQSPPPETSTPALPAGAATAPSVAPTHRRHRPQKILSGIDYRGIVFDTPKIEPAVAIVRPFGSAGSFLITGIEPLSSLHASAVHFGESTRTAGTRSLA